MTKHFFCITFPPPPCHNFQRNWKALSKSKPVTPRTQETIFISNLWISSCFQSPPPIHTLGVTIFTVAENKYWTQIPGPREPEKRYPHLEKYAHITNYAIFDSASPRNQHSKLSANRQGKWIQWPWKPSYRFVNFFCALTNFKNVLLDKTWKMRCYLCGIQWMGYGRRGKGNQIAEMRIYTWFGKRVRWQLAPQLITKISDSGKNTKILHFPPKAHVNV